MQIPLTILVLLFIASYCNAHLYFITPEAQGGPSSYGGNTSPCGLGSIPANPPVTTLTQYSIQTLNFKVNLHGPGPFSLVFAQDGTTFDTTILSGFQYAITADTESTTNSMVLQYQVPGVTCSNCVLQLKGMAQSDGSSEWYNCANIAIIAPPCSSFCMPSNGKCNSDNTCICKTGFAGHNCSFPTLSNGNVILNINIETGINQFDKTAFLAGVASETGLPGSDIKLLSVKKTSDPDVITVQIELTNGGKSSVSGAAAGLTIQTRVASNQTVGTYQTQSVTNVSGQKKKSSGGTSSGGAAAAAIVVILVVVGAFGGLIWYWKKNGNAPDRVKELLHI